VSVVLPVVREAELLEDAAGCVLSQTLRQLELLIVCNGSDEATISTAQQVAMSDRRVKVIRLAKAGLAAALNVGISEARSDLVARMDADDWCPPQRLERQAAFLESRPELGGVGCWYEEESAHRRVIVRPPTDPAEARWRLLTGNVFAHGSMMLRKDALLETGGYDESCPRSQDYDLWLRMSRRWGLCALPEVLYRHRVEETASFSRSSAQAEHAARAMVEAWRMLPPGEGVERPLARAMAGDAAGALEEIETRLRASPSREWLLGWLWLRDKAPGWERNVMEACRGARVREVVAQVRAAGGEEVWLWGAGAHGGVVLDLVRGAGMNVAGFVDDGCVGESRWGYVVQEPATLQAGSHVLLASDAHENALWAASAGARERGVKVWRLYG